MRLKLVSAAITAALFISLLGATSASAATEVGNRCAANTSNGPFMFVSLANGSDTLPATIPSSGVITRWSFSIGLPVGEVVLFETLKVFRPTGVPQQLQVVGESSKERTFGGTQTFSTRIPVKTGDLIGALAEVPPATGTVFCETGNPGDRVGVISGSGGVGSTTNIAGEEAGIQNPVVVFVEPDADNDGFGDETQDQCPQSASTQAPCPVVTLSASAVVKKGLATVLVTSNLQAPVTVAGKVKLGKGKTAKLSGGTQVVVPGTIAKFTLLFPRALKAALKALNRKRSLPLVLTASAPNVVGAPATSEVKAKARGQKKPARKGKRKGKGGKRG